MYKMVSVWCAYATSPGQKPRGDGAEKRAGGRLTVQVWAEYPQVLPLATTYYKYGVGSGVGK